MQDNVENLNKDSAFLRIKQRFVFDVAVLFALLFVTIAYAYSADKSLYLLVKSSILGFLAFMISIYVFVLYSFFNLEKQTKNIYKSFSNIIIGTILKYLFLFIFCICVFKFLFIDPKYFIFSFIFTLVLSNFFSFKYLNQNKDK